MFVKIAGQFVAFIVGVELCSREQFNAPLSLIVVDLVGNSLERGWNMLICSGARMQGTRWPRLLPGGIRSPSQDKKLLPTYGIFIFQFLQGIPNRSSVVSIGCKSTILASLYLHLVVVW